MDILYIFPHPDDESFGPASAIHSQVSAGHRVHLLTLTKGGATKVRHQLGLDVDAMGTVRVGEMKCMQKVLGLSSMEIWDLPDSGLSEFPADKLVDLIADHILKIRPDVVVTYAEHGISGFPDHVVAHHVVKDACKKLKQQASVWPKRLAYFTISERHLGAGEQGWHKLHHSDDRSIDCMVAVTERDTDAFQAALDCYETYQDTIQKSGIRKLATLPACFEFEGESFQPPLGDLCEHLN